MRMISIDRTTDHRLDIAFRGSIDADGMRALIDELQAKSLGIEDGTMLYTVGDFDFPSFGAIGVELSRIPALFRIMRRFRKVALVADEAWVRAVGRIEGALIPGLELRAFAPEERAQAESWLLER
jgi:hypothetical protein